MKREDNKSKLMLIIIIGAAIIFLVLLTVFLILLSYSFTPEEREISAGQGISSAVIRNNTAYVTLDENIDLSKISQVEFIFMSSENFYFSTVSIKREYEISASSLQLKNLDKIESVDVSFKYKSDIPVATCYQTCSSLHYECGYQIICGEQKYCGSCSYGERCSSGSCVSSGECSSDSDCSRITGTCGKGRCSSGNCYTSYNSSYQVCRQSSGECDATDYCSGSSISCTDRKVADGSSCSSGTCSGGYCSNTAYCGNGAVDTGELCDSGSLGGKTCAYFGFNSGTLKCCSNCSFDTSSCINSSSSCYDSDGDNYSSFAYVKITTNFTSGKNCSGKETITSQNYTVADSCLDSSILNERICNLNGSDGIKVYNCSLQGKVCSGGVCAAVGNGCGNGVCQGGIGDTAYLGSEKTVSLGGKQFTIWIEEIIVNSVNLSVNEENTGILNEGGHYDLSDGTRIYVASVNESNNPALIDFVLGETSVTCSQDCPSLGTLSPFSIRFVEIIRRLFGII